MSTRTARAGEKGQALILIVLAVAGLFGLTALAVDGSHVFAQRRQAQNAADTAAFAAAIGCIQNAATGSDCTATTATMDSSALARAASNSFADTLNDAGVNAGEPVDVIVIYPPDHTAPEAYWDNHEYVQVKINANIGTFFAKVVGVDTLPIHVQAVARAKPPFTAPVGGDNGIVALGDVCDAVRTHGSGQTTITGGGVYSNSSANGSQGNCWAFNGKGTGGQITIPDTTVVGCPHGIDPGDLGSQIILTGPENDCATPIFYPPPPPDLGVTCSSLPVGTRTGTTAHYGQWSTALGNLGGNQVFPPAGVTTLDPGVYCINGHFNLGASDTLESTGPVTFILNGDLRWNAQATINLIPSDTGKLAGLLIYRPLNYPDGSCSGDGTLPGTNACQTLEFNGGADSNWSGTIYAPDSNCDINGTSDSFTPDAQAICYVVDIGGTSAWNMTYNGANNWDFPYPPSTQLSR